MHITGIKATFAFARMCRMKVIETKDQPLLALLGGFCGLDFLGSPELKKSKS
jgi:hypothetical protein